MAMADGNATAWRRQQQMRKATGLYVYATSTRQENFISDKI
jgi:hypothetical protein